MKTESILSAQRALSPVSRQAATEGIVLLKNDDQTLPLTQGDVVSLFGRCQINTYRSGTGSGGSVNVPYAISFLQGLREHTNIQVNESLASVYEEWIGENPFDTGGDGWAAEPWFQKEMPVTQTIVETAAKQSNKAIVFIGRTAGEDKDNADASGSYRLTDDELDVLNTVTAQFDNVVVVLNVTNIIDMSWLTTLENKAAIKSVLYAWSAGMEAGHALADVLSGDRSPSGKLTDTIAYRLEDYPSSPNFGRKDFNLYAEDIYVGYRYFETFHRDAVQFAFGEGLSYTTFSRELSNVSITGEGAQSLCEFTVEVTNTGDTFSGKEVVQLYVEAPQGKLGKASRALIGFAKTEVLSPGESQTVQLSIPVSVFASYDDSGVTGYKNSYVLEAGEYYFYLGESVRRAKKISAVFSLPTLQIVETLTEALAPVKSFNRLLPGEKLADGSYAKSEQAVPLRTVSLADRIQQNLPVSMPITGDKGIKLKDVASGDHTMEDFIAQLTEEQLAIIVRGEGMCSPKVTPGTASAFGGVSDDLFALGIPVAATADGPSGIRMDSGHKASQVPIGTLLASSWNIPLNEQLFELVGQELIANDIDTLLGPGINIHRHPLNGRNFEYFSEDPFLTGTIASAQTRGLKQAGVSGTIKHFAANDQETARFDVDSVMSERALREIHVKPFEMAVKQGGATTIMTAYNPINGHWTASSYDLNTTLLREEWGFTGIVMTDWWAKMNDPISGGKESKTYTSFMVRSQNDLYMVVENDGAGNNVAGDNTLQALNDGTLTVGELQRSAMNICRFIIDAPVMQRPLKAYDPVKTIKPVNEKPVAATSSIEAPVQVGLNHDGQLCLDVREAGEYQWVVNAQYDKNSIAQSSCSFSLNNEYCWTFPLNGTDGKPVRVEGVSLRLEPGFYTVDVQFVKPGLMLDSFEFLKA